MDKIIRIDWRNEKWDPQVDIDESRQSLVGKMTMFGLSNWPINEKYGPQGV